MSAYIGKKKEICSLCLKEFESVAFVSNYTMDLERNQMSLEVAVNDVEYRAHVMDCTYYGKGKGNE